MRWQGKPVFIVHRTEAQIARAEADDRAATLDPAKDRTRVKRKEWLVVVGVCTHLGCVPTSLSQEVGAALGAQAGEAKLRDVITSGGFRSVRRAAETPFNMILEARL